MKLNNPPYLQIALDLVDKEKLKSVLSQIPKSENILIEAGTPLIKKFGIQIVKDILDAQDNAYIIADMKTLDVGFLEVQIAAEENAKAVSISGLASVETIESAIDESILRSTDLILDLMNVKDPLDVLNKLNKKPDVLLFHRGIDQENREEHPWDLIKKIRDEYPQTLIAVAGGLDLEKSQKALENGADIIIIGRAITQSRDVSKSIKQFLAILN
ncbi:MAG: orotidine 5'-phosphate decarboxylase [Candidatus Heimdallarchaeota archaeon]|jgi:bifunctional enzyme Fae/Hps|nr:orotidine 5'-phosphate decarboxylase [Candidatus Heimdallarchaeota archaeon]